MAILVHVIIWNKLLNVVKDAETEKGGRQTLLKGTDKILNMLKSLSGL